MNAVLFFYFLNGFICGAILLHEIHKFKKFDVKFFTAIQRIFGGLWSLCILCAFFYCIYVVEKSGEIGFSVKIKNLRNGSTNSIQKGVNKVVPGKEPGYEQSEVGGEGR